MTAKDISEKIDAILPQTQCGLCNFPGCKPYADALANHEAEIDQCPPGGVKGLTTIAEILNRDPTPYIAAMEKKAKPTLVALIREAECIGCTKCIVACPIDAILGGAKQMHTVLIDECTGCELCIAPCPVDCIDMVSAPEPTQSKAPQYRARYYAHNQRLANQKQLAAQPTSHTQLTNNTDKKSYVQSALERVKQKKKI